LHWGIRRRLRKSIAYNDPHILPLTKFPRRYFFHASNARVETDGYVEDAATEDEDALGSSNTRLKVVDEAGSPVIKEEVDVDMDPVLADWLKIDDKSPQGERAKYDDYSATDEDSDNVDVAQEMEGEREEDDLDDWSSVKEPVTEGSTVKFSSLSPPLVLSLMTGLSQESQADAKMGESETAMEYDQQLIFKHLFVHFNYHTCVFR